MTYLGLPASFWIAIILAAAVLVGVLVFVRQLEKNEPVRQATERAKRSTPGYGEALL